MILFQYEQNNVIFTLFFSLVLYFISLFLCSNLKLCNIMLCRFSLVEVRFRYRVTPMIVHLQYLNSQSDKDLLEKMEYTQNFCEFLEVLVVRLHSMITIPHFYSFRFQVLPQLVLEALNLIKSSYELEEARFRVFFQVNLL